jgi:hypothetical protein
MTPVDQITTDEQPFWANLQHCELIQRELVVMSPAGFDRNEIAVLAETDTLTGGDVLPGFSVSVADIFT